MINEIKGQPVSFTDQYCGDYCLTLANNAICGDYVDNPTFLGDPVNDWSVNNGTQTGERTFTDLASVELRQTISLPIGSYRLFYKVETDTNNWSGTLQLTGLSTSGTLFSSSTNFVESGVLDFTVGSGTNRTCDFLLSFGSPTQVITTHYFYICERDAFVPESDFCFQMPLFNDGSELLGADTVDLDAVISDTHTPGTPGTNGVVGPVSNVCGNGRTDTYDTPHLALADGEDGDYFIKYEIESGSITYSDYGDVSQQLRLKYSVNSGPGEGYIDFNVNSLTGGFKTQTAFEPSGATSCIVELLSQYEDDGSGTCYVSYTMGVLNSDAWKMWQEDTFTAADDTFYRLKFKNNNTTSTTVKIYDSASTLLFQFDSDGVLFDKTFKTGSLPVDKTITIRYEFDEFIDSESTDWFNSILTEATLYKQCKYDVWLETEGEVFVQNLTEDHDTTGSTTTLEYNHNIEYCLDVNTVSPGKYQFRALNDCDGTEVYISNAIYICGGSCDDLKQFSYTPTAVKCVGNDTLDYVNYPSTQFFWLKMDLQDITMDDERVAYRQSDGFWNVPYAINQSFETLQVWPVPVFVRRAIASGMQDTFEIHGVEYLKVEEDDYSLQFTARHDNAMRIVVSKVGDFSISRNG